MTLKEKIEVLKLAAQIASESGRRTLAQGNDELREDYEKLIEEQRAAGAEKQGKLL